MSAIMKRNHDNDSFRDPSDYHMPVLLNEVTEGLHINRDGIYVDCTFGGGGHSAAILKKLNADAKLIVFDQDEAARKNLPEKLEQISYCELTDEQAAVYQQLLAATRTEVHNAVGAQGLARSRMVVLTALLRLRQVCCDLRLLGPRPSDDDTPTSNPAEGAPAVAVAPSGKLQLFGELLDEILDGGHRVLVFSQFTKMLDLLRDELDARGLTHCRLDGSTRDRGAVVEKFQKDDSVPVFLISLKAGGVGLNLTGADTVVHFDPWWNPAVEDQATDRAHRIGQTRVVTGYKLITRGTVEEKILSLQQKKRGLINAMLTGEDAFTNALTWEEIQELLS